MSCWRDEVETSMDAVVMVTVEHAFDLEFLLEVCIKFGIDVVNDGLPAEKQQLSPFMEHVPDGINQELAVPTEAT